MLAKTFPARERTRPQAALWRVTDVEKEEDGECASRFHATRTSLQRCVWDGLRPSSGIIGLLQFSFTSMRKCPCSNRISPHRRNSFRAGIHIKRPLRIALFGFGTVASSVARILIESALWARTHPHLRPQRGEKASGLDSSSVVWSEDADAVLASDVDVVVELAGA